MLFVEYSDIYIYLFIVRKVAYLELWITVLHFMQLLEEPSFC